MQRHCVLTLCKQEFKQGKKVIEYDALRVKSNFTSDALVQFYKICRTRYDKSAKTWILSLRNLRYFYRFCKLQSIEIDFDFDIRKIEKHRLECKLKPEDKLKLDSFLAAGGHGIEPTQLKSHLDVISHLKKKLFPYQEKGLDWGYETGFRCLIADEMGLGKTLQAIACMSAVSAKRVLIVCPASVCFAWESEIAQAFGMSPEESSAQIAVVKGVATQCPKVRYIITSFASGRQNIVNLTSHGLDMVVIDESHNLKNPAAKQSKVFLPIVSIARHAIALTGTPALNRIPEMYGICRALRPDLFVGSPQVFLQAEKRLMGVIKSHIMIRRLKSEVLGDLPPKTRSHFLVQESDLDLTKFNEFNQSLGEKIDQYQEGFEELKSEILARFGNTDRAEQELEKAYKRFEKGLEGSAFGAFKAAGEAKAEFVGVYARDYALSSQDPIIVFYHHQDVGDVVQAQLRGVDVMRISGSTKEADRKAYIEGFQGGKYKVALLSLLACNSGITLTKASHIVFSELWWTPSILLQAEARAHRIGQVNPVTCQYVLASGTYDDDMYKLILSKWDDINKNLDNSQNEAIEASNISQGSVMRALIRKLVSSRNNFKQSS